MRRIFILGLCILEACLGAPQAQAQVRWVGNWFRVPEASRRSAHSFTLSMQPDGTLRHDDGGSVLVIALSGKATPEPILPTASILVLEHTLTSFSYEEIIEGQPVIRVEERLSSDGKRLIGRRVSINKDGRERAREFEAVQIGTGEGLAGRWRELPPPPRGAGSAAQQAGSPFWVITQDTSGQTTWKIPQTGEVLHGAADGRHHATTDALQLPGRTYTLRTLSSRHLLWSFYETGHLVEHAEERLSADGKFWTDLIWRPAHPHERPLRLSQEMIQRDLG